MTRSFPAPSRRARTSRSSTSRCPGWTASRPRPSSEARCRRGGAGAAPRGDAIRRVARGQRVVDPALALAALSEGANPLSEREREALALAATSGTIADIAATLGLSEGTVRNHLSAAIQKVGARNRAEAARIAADKGWLEPEREG